MGKMNLLKGNWYGKVGQTVGAKWKNRSTIRTYTAPSNPNTQAQQTVRSGFKDVTSFVALFADGIRYLSALPTAGQSVRNAIIKINKEMVAGNSFAAADLLISKGGLQAPQNVAVSFASGIATVTWDAPTATNITAKAKAVVVAVDAAGKITDTMSALASAGTVTGTVALTAGEAADIYVYFLDYRGSNKVASNSVYKTATIA